MNELDAQALLDRVHGTLGGFYAGTTGDVAVRELFTPDVAWHVPGHNAIAGDYLGVDEVLDYLARRHRDHCRRRASLVHARSLSIRRRSDRGMLAVAPGPTCL